MKQKCLTDKCEHIFACPDYSWIQNIRKLCLKKISQKVGKPPSFKFNQTYTKLFCPEDMPPYVCMLYIYVMLSFIHKTYIQDALKGRVYCHSYPKNTINVTFGEWRLVEVVHEWVRQIMIHRHFLSNRRGAMKYSHPFILLCLES